MLTVTVEMLNCGRSTLLCPRLEVSHRVALITHPREGRILLNTGLSPRYYSQASRWPWILSAWANSVLVGRDDSLVCQLEERGVLAPSIGLILLTHFHPPCLAGLRDFPEVPVVCSREGHRALRRYRGLKAWRHGLMEPLLPGDFEQHVSYLESTTWTVLPEQLRPFEGGWDLFEDGTVIGVPLPGYALGCHGLLCRSHQGWLFLVVEPRGLFPLNRTEAGRTAARTRRLQGHGPGLELVFIFRYCNILDTDRLQNTLPSQALQRLPPNTDRIGFPSPKA